MDVYANNINVNIIPNIMRKNGTKYVDTKVAKAEELKSVLFLFFC